MHSYGFRPCNACAMPCKNARKKDKTTLAIKREILKQELKEKGCPYVSQPKAKV